MKHVFAAVGLFALTASAAFAHATLEKPEAAQGAAYKAVVRIGHGCGAEPTLKVRVQIPEGVIAVKPMPKAGWALETVKGAYAKSYMSFGKLVTEGVTEIVWTGELPSDFYDEFVFSARITDAFAVGDLVSFPTIQECASGSERWVEIPAAGQDPHDLKGPAPSVTVIEPGHSH